MLAFMFPTLRKLVLGGFAPGHMIQNQRPKLNDRARPLIYPKASEPFVVHSESICSTLYPMTLSHHWRSTYLLKVEPNFSQVDLRCACSKYWRFFLHTCLGGVWLRRAVDFICTFFERSGETAKSCFEHRPERNTHQHRPERIRNIEINIAANC